MKKLLIKIRNPRLLRPAIKQMLTKCTVGIAVALLWDYFADTANHFSVIEYLFPIIGAVFAALAWFNYLAADGITPPRYLSFTPKKRPTRQTGDIADFTDEPIHIADLEPEERAVCKLMVNIVCAVFFLLPGVIFLLI